MKDSTLILLVCLMTIEVHAGSNRVDTLTLDQALALAETHHPDLAEARALADAAAGRTWQSGAFPNPELIGRIEALPLESNSTRDPDYLVGISQTVPLGGRLGSARDAGRLDQARVTREAGLKRMEVRKEVHGAFATALYQEKVGHLQSRIAEDQATALGISRARMEHGDATPDEVARAELELLRARAELQRGENLTRQARIALAGAVGLPNLEVNTLAGDLDDVLELETIEAVALDPDNSPAIATALANVEAQQALVDLAEAGRIPDIKVEALYRRVESSHNSLDLGVSIPLPFWDRNQGRIRESRAELAAAEARTRATTVQTEQRLRHSQTQLAAALEQARTLRHTVLPFADTINNTLERRLAAGDISLAEVIPVRRDWAAVQLSYLETLRDVMAAWNEVRALTGTL